MAAEAPFKNHKPRGRGSQPRRRNQGGKLKIVFVPKSELDSSNSELDRSLDELSIREDFDVARELDPENKNGSELKNEVENKGEESHADDSDKEGNSVYSRLDKQMRDVGEPELSEEQLSVNDQLQEDELLALEAIYGENVLKLERWKGLRCFQIHTHIEVLDAIGIKAKLNSSNEHKTASSNADDFSYSFKVKYLPPIILTCLLPKSYPSHQPPHFIISVKWLDSTRISSLCSMLDSIWTEQQGQEVIYQWVEWLHGFSLSHLGFDKEITLGPYGMKHVGDERAVSGAVSLDFDVPSLRSYNNERRHENFLKEMHECGICFNVYAGTEFAQLPCQHFFCLKCLQTFAQMHVKEGTLNNLQCPGSKCAVMFTPALLKCLLDDKEYERWESLMLEKTLESMSDVAYCPRCETPCIEDEEQHAQCSKCFFSFCTLCREKLQILQERQNSSQLKGAQRLKEREMINEMLSVKEIRRDSKLCPSCQMAISRTEGCNKMVCGNCGEYFCYRCNKALAESDPYGHFRDGSCELFPQEMVEAWQERINHRQVVAQIQAELLNERGQRCPNCRQFNAKVGNNNHMFCWACQCHYCYSCKQIVRRSAQHYGPKGCKQHSDD
ncbi:hypothetical protein K1719_017046 [Acacia pycnantha]|nr:hypothetical protein K1719_017046 [Acacia pycnantha]